ncbi:hypothetical protein LIER_04922 [Lithospermum erythrorhizon]|uniref:Uncharacterized protein n=1 Tax=Lithospermum erythrorhizon TaxID=34254 RepID=A0AAV3NYS8_LITER
MEGLSSKSSVHKNIRSVSLPPRSHPATVKVEQAVNKLKTNEASGGTNSEVICNKLCGMIELYVGVEELLGLQFVRRALSQNQHDSRVDVLLKESVKFLDICSNTRDIVMKIKQAITDVQCSVRRSKTGDFTRTEANVAAYISMRKNVQKDIARFITVLKHSSLVSVPLSNSDTQFSAAQKVLTEASIVTMSIFQSLLLFLSVPVMKPKPNRWSLVSKLMNKGTLAGEDQSKKMNELENVDLALGKLTSQDSSKHLDAEKIELADKRMKELETRVQVIENGLEDVFKHLIRSRVSLLNIFSQ